MSSLRRESIIIACAADARYALPLAVMLRSALEHLGPAHQLEAYVVDDGIDPADKARVERSLTDHGSVHWVAPQRRALGGLPLWGRMAVTTYDKLFVADFVPAHAERAIWLDSDLLVLRDLAELWHTAMDGSHLLAVRDQLVPRVSSRFGVAGWAELGIAPDAPYFNAGVAVIDCRRWRRDGLRERALEYLHRFRERVFFWDQEALNAVLSGRWAALDPRWNRALGFQRPSPPRAGHGDGAEAWILHFSGNLKPWTYSGHGASHALYFEYLDRTAWATWRPPHSWSSRLLALYESSPLRRLLYPAEQWGLRALRWATLRYTPAAADQ